MALHNTRFQRVGSRNLTKGMKALAELRVDTTDIPDPGCFKRLEDFPGHLLLNDPDFGPVLIRMTTVHTYVPAPEDPTARFLGAADDTVVVEDLDDA